MGRGVGRSRRDCGCYLPQTSIPPDISVGPTAIVEASQQVERYDETPGVEPSREWDGIAKAEPLALCDQVEQAAVEAIERFVRPHMVGLIQAARRQSR